MNRLAWLAVVTLATPSAAFAPASRPSLPHYAKEVGSPLPMRTPDVVVSRARPLQAAVSEGSPATPGSDVQLDLGALGRYLFAVLIQMFGISVAFGVIDLATYGPLPGDIQLAEPLPWQAVAGVFFLLSVRSRVFSPLDNSRPDVREIDIPAEEESRVKSWVESGKTKSKELMLECEKRGLQVDNTMDRPEMQRRLSLYFEELEAAAGARAAGGGAAERSMPSWTPPGVTFPIMWVLIVAPLRAYAASLVYEASTGRLNEAHMNDPVLLWLVLHLAIGDTWNTINNVERRTGAAVPGVSVVWLSTIFAARQFYDVSPLAGQLLGLTAVWITVAGVLVADTWRINTEVAPEPLYPYKRQGRRSQTRFSFEE
jgi:benzodiazapine receptor